MKIAIQPNEWGFCFGQAAIKHFLSGALQRETRLHIPSSSHLWPTLLYLEGTPTARSWRRGGGLQPLTKPWVPRFGTWIAHLIIFLFLKWTCTDRSGWWQGLLLRRHGPLQAELFPVSAERSGVKAWPFPHVLPVDIPLSLPLAFSSFTSPEPWGPLSMPESTRKTITAVVHSRPSPHSLYTGRWPHPQQGVLG